jgi:hypothetical protein
MSIPGYHKGQPQLPESPITLERWAQMQEAALFGPDDAAALRRSKAILAPRVEEILDVWYGFVGSKPFLLEQFSDRSTHEPDAAYLGRVRAHFGQWILDTADAQYDESWLRWQFEIGRRHHRVGKNTTDGASATALVPFSYLVPLAQPIVQTLRPFLAATGEPSASVDEMQESWRKSVLLQVTLWSFPYIIAGDY